MGFANYAASDPTRQRGIRAFGSLEQLIESVDVVHVNTPPYAHEPVAVAALAAGKFVICEKPLALSEADCDEMIQAMEKAGVPFYTAFCYRFSGSALKTQSRKIDVKQVSKMVSPARLRISTPGCRK